MAYRESRLSFRVSEEEKAHLKKAASTPDSSGKKYKDMSEFIRGTLLERTGFQSTMVKLQLNELLYETNKIGVNINQTVKKINAGFGSHDDIELLLSGQRKLCESVEKYTEMVESLWQSQS